MKPNRPLFRIALPFLAVLPALAGELSFELVAPTTAVALQFDVSSTGSPVSFGTPVFQGASPHRVESNTIAPGTTRFVVYTTTGLRISPTGRISVSLAAPAVPSNGMMQIQVSSVVASDNDGVRMDAQPNALPVSLDEPAHRSVEVGRSTLLAANVVDPDGTVSAVEFRLNGTQVATAASGSQSAPWSASTPGLFALSASVSHSAGQIAEISLGSLHAYQLADITNLASFNSIHYGGDPDAPFTSFGGDPFGIGIPNGLALLFGINPHDPDRSRLPSVTVEPDGTGGRDMVFRFHRPTALSGLNWAVQETETLNSWSNVPGTRRSETPLGDGRTRVEARRSITPASPKAFMNVQASPTP
jgi:hypothetical protein